MDVETLKRANAIENELSDISRFARDIERSFSTKAKLIFEYDVQGRVREHEINKKLKNRILRVVWQYENDLKEKFDKL